jgi:hypothetical protein
MKQRGLFAALCALLALLTLAHASGDCGVLSVANGVMAPDCTGLVSSTCTYAACDAGFEFSAEGNLTRTCINGTFTGSPKTCKRRFLVWLCACDALFLHAAGLFLLP